MDRTCQYHSYKTPFGASQNEGKRDKEVCANEIRSCIARVQEVRLVFEQHEDFGSVHYAPAYSVHKSQVDIWKHIRKMEGLSFQQ
ncbi:hypothetical protein AVEN_186512-1 [Araneus ventricosus]|uniref:Uncharacterized protein n=1 Tax=Araneus ventricosus TaxID=182803 RepID=A0A4Y2N681_ARAVE|nr:hypothetical protein AVEN_186512-1 [Araneus ventricosus]